jgi:hypothetical protein
MVQAGKSSIPSIKITEAFMGRKVLLITVFCIFLLGMAQGEASAACREDCFISCCGSTKVCNEPDKVSCLSNCIKGCAGDNTSVKSEESKSADLNVQICQANNRAEVRACSYPKREVEATRQCLQEAREHFDSCMRDIGR